MVNDCDCLQNILVLSTPTTDGVIIEVGEYSNYTYFIDKNSSVTALVVHVLYLQWPVSFA